MKKILAVLLLLSFNICIAAIPLEGKWVYTVEYKIYDNNTISYQIIGVVPSSIIARVFTGIVGRYNVEDIPSLSNYGVRNAVAALLKSNYKNIYLSCSTYEDKCENMLFVIANNTIKHNELLIDESDSLKNLNRWDISPIIPGRIIQKPQNGKILIYTNGFNWNLYQFNRSIPNNVYAEVIVYVPKTCEAEVGDHYGELKDENDNKDSHKKYLWYLYPQKGKQTKKTEGVAEILIDCNL